jgi:AcrR family transcriptional regulator
MNNITEYKKELRSKILSVAMAMFKKNGIKSVKMDDIANALQISKRTLYEIYENKERLLLECVREDRNNTRNHLMEFASHDCCDEMDILIEFFKMKMSDLEMINPKFFLELQKYSDVVDYLYQSRDEEILRSIQFIERGVEHGYFLKELNYSIVVRIADASMNYFIANEMYLR